MRLDEYLLSVFQIDPAKVPGLLLSGDVLVNDTPVKAAGHLLKESDHVRLRNQRRWVARSGEKLAQAIETFQFRVEGRVFIDSGSSTGGFTQVLLENNAAHIYSVDVGYGLLHLSLRNLEKVTVLERRHINSLTVEDFALPPECFVLDLSFISLQKVLPHLKMLLPGAEGIALMKPQFEAEARLLEKGILKNSDHRTEVIAGFESFLHESGITVHAVVDSATAGSKGNIERLYHLSL